MKKIINRFLIWKLNN